jgi:hypothetical protein
MIVKRKTILNVRNKDIRKINSALNLKKLHLQLIKAYLELIIWRLELGIYTSQYC